MTLGAEAEEAKVLTTPIRNVQALRSAATSHRKGSRFDHLVQRLSVAPLSQRERILSLILDATRALAAIRALIERTPSQ